MKQEATDETHVVKPSGTIVETLEWLNAYGITRAWYLHGRTGSAVCFQENYRDKLQVAQQGDKMRAIVDNKNGKTYIVVHGPSDDDEIEGRRSPANMIESGGSSAVSPPIMDHGYNDGVTAQDGVPVPGRVRVYVAGPMTGLPEFNYPAFRFAAEQLRLKGYVVADPSTNNLPEGSQWRDYMKVTIPQMLRCDGVALLDHWEDSKGATLEVHIARALAMEVKPLEEWLR